MYSSSFIHSFIHNFITHPLAVLRCPGRQINLEKYLTSSSTRPRLVAALLFFCNFEYDDYKFMQCILFRCFKFTKFGQLILRQIVKIAATRWQILRLKCTQLHMSFYGRTRVYGSEDRLNRDWTARADIVGL